jgi:hypothetical protein
MRTPGLVLVLSALTAAAGCGRGKPAADDPPPAEPAPPPAPPREQVENPLYRSWAAFKKGTSVVHKSVTAADGNEAVTTTTTTCTLLDRTDDHVVVEMRAKTRRYDGVETDNPPERLTNPRRIGLPPGMTRADFEKAAGAGPAEETLKLGGKEYRTRRRTSKDRNEAGEVFVDTWTSDAVPGGLVRSVTRTPAIGKTTTQELVEVRTP